MKFSVGYPNEINGSFFELLTPYLSSIGELYFPWSDIASGRKGIVWEDYRAQERFEEELSRFSENKIRLNLLLNGNCYGELAISNELSYRVCSLVDYLCERFGLNAVTTSSPFLAQTVKKNFGGVEVRASVNMWIDGISGMSQCLDIFDSFYVKREYNRNIKEVEKQYRFCHENGKKLYMLANSGCLPNCPYHIFHDNIVSHEKEISHIKNDEQYIPYSCHRVMSVPENHYMLLAGNWVRPEDICNYEGIIDGVKLATRIHFSPVTVIGAYVRKHHMGDLCMLTEPGFGKFIAPYYLENSAIPEDFFTKTSSCLRDCASCGYCRTVFDSIKRNLLQ